MATSAKVMGSTPVELNVRELMNSLQHACDLDLLRLRTAIDHLLMNPARILAVRQRLHVGQEVHFWALRDNRLLRGRITQFKSDQLMILSESPPQCWWVSYAALQIDPNDSLVAKPPRNRGRADFAPGDTVSFEGRDLVAHLGTIIRLNQKTATVSCDRQAWRVSFALLRHVVDL